MVRSKSLKNLALKSILVAVNISLLLPIASITLTRDSYAANPSAMSPKRLHFYKRAATKFWGSRGELSGVPCLPIETRVKHYVFVDDPSTPNVNETVFAAVAQLWSAYKKAPNGYTFTDDQYCSFSYNQSIREDSRSACITFIHEYGHMLGKDHTADVGSPMFADYEVRDASKAVRAQLQIRNIKIRLAKSICGNLKKTPGYF